MGVVSQGQVVVQGAAATVAYAIDASGRMRAKEFFDLKGGSDALTKQEKIGLWRLFEYMANNGEINNEEQFRKERGDIWGFKKNQARVAAFQQGNVWYLTHGFKKQQNKWPVSELDRADRIRSEHLRR